jgi:hypothetical protein
MGFGAALVGSILSLAALRTYCPDAWRLNFRYFLAFIVFHGVLLGVLLTVCMVIDLNLSKLGGILRAVAVALTGSALVIVLGPYPPVALLLSGLAFVTPFVATFIYAALRTWRSGT